MAIKGVFFDLGGTLFSYSGLAGAAGIAHVVSELGLRGDSRTIGKAWKDAAASVGERYGRQPYFLHKDLFRDTLQAFLQTFGETATEQLAEDFHQHQLESVVEHLPLREDCHATLGELRRRGLYVSLVSNIDDDYLQPLLLKHALEQCLDDWTSSEAAASCKPDAAIYHYVLQKSGLKVDEVLFVGDSLHHDVAGAAAVGMRSVRIVEPGIDTPLTHGLEVTASPDYEIGTLSELLTLLEAT